MLISTLEELRLFSPSNAIDTIDSLAGFLNSSEHDFLEDKLGPTLYAALTSYYKTTVKPDPQLYIDTIIDDADAPAYARLLYIAQKAVTFDALSRAINVQAISVNGAGVNMATADDYKSADATSIADYKKACCKEAHSAVNELLNVLERWAQSDSADEKQTEIVDLWKASRYFYLAASMLIPSAAVLQNFYNIYDSREKFIQLLPDIRYIQEDVLAPIFGEDFIDYIAKWATANPSQDSRYSSKYQPAQTILVLRILNSLRKIVARHLEARLLKPTDARHDTAYNEAVKLTTRLSEFLQVRQVDMSADLLDAFSTSPLYQAPTTSTTSDDSYATFQNNADGNVIFVTPGLM